MFKLISPYKPTGDQPEAINNLVKNLKAGVKNQVLLGATGTGKTYTIANVIEKMNKNTLVLVHNKTLAGQLYAELKELFPENHVEYFISYYDYYQPEAYVVATDTYIEKDSSINDEIDEMRHAATQDLINYDDVIIVASVSCIYGIGDPETYKNSMIVFKVGDKINLKQTSMKLVELLYERVDFDLKAGSFRVRGDIIDIIPATTSSKGIRIETFDDEIESIKTFDVLTGVVREELSLISVFPATHFMTDKNKLEESLKRIRNELDERIKFFQTEGKLLEAQRIKERTNYDLSMLEETGSCSGVENYSRHLALKEEGMTPSVLVDFFGNDFLTIIDESHVTIPQIRGMYNGDRSRKTTLVDYGFRLPSALDNRPLKFDEFKEKIGPTIYLSATPGDYEIDNHFPIVEQIIRPTGLLDPIIEIRKTMGQIDDLYAEILKRKEKNERVLVTTLTIRMAEDLSGYLKGLGLKVSYLHSNVKSLERLEIIRDLRLGKYDCLVGINLLREGLDLPEVSLVAILDADKEGFLRAERSLIQTIGRAARNENGKVIMYADTISNAMEKAIFETNRRREIQTKFNEEHGIIPKTIIKKISEPIKIKRDIKEQKTNYNPKFMSPNEYETLVKDIEKQMREAAKALDFERALELRDLLFELREERGSKK